MGVSPPLPSPPGTCSSGAKLLNKVNSSSYILPTEKDSINYKWDLDTVCWVDLIFYSVPLLFCPHFRLLCSTCIFPENNIIIFLEWNRCISHKTGKKTDLKILNYSLRLFKVMLSVAYRLQKDNLLIWRKNIREICDKTWNSSDHVYSLFKISVCSKYSTKFSHYPCYHVQHVYLRVFDILYECHSNRHSRIRPIPLSPAFLSLTDTRCFYLSS